MTRACASCGQLNRIPTRHLADRGKCGKCGAALAPESRPLEVTTEQFQDIIAHATVPVVVDFWAPWCGPCRMAAPHVQSAANELAGEALVLKVNTDDEQDLAQRYAISSIPTFALFSRGQLVRQQAGLMDRAQLVRLARSGS